MLAADGKAMKPAWDKLMKQYDGHASILVGDVDGAVWAWWGCEVCGEGWRMLGGTDQQSKTRKDCIGDGKSMCDDVGVEGFPTIKFGDPANLEDYEGEREFDDLDKFAKENLGPRCGPANLDLCDADAWQPSAWDVEPVSPSKDKKKKIEEFINMPAASLKKENCGMGGWSWEIEAKDEEIAAAVKKHEEFVESLQKQYEE
eukprot:Skav234673  [mRNA]  locus=scaffold1131:470468:472215:- [translate_table: standard]